MTRPGAPPCAPASWLPHAPTASAPPPGGSAPAPRAASAPRCVTKSTVNRTVPTTVMSRSPVPWGPNVKIVLSRQGSSPALAVPAGPAVPAVPAVPTVPAVSTAPGPSMAPRTTVAAHSPGLVIQRSAAPGAQLCCAPLPTWAAPATPPRATSGAKESSQDFLNGTSKVLPLPHSGAGSASGDRLDEDALRVKLEVTRRELNQKMSELRELEASLLSTSFSKRLEQGSSAGAPALHRPMAAVAVDVLVEESETTGHSDGTPSPDSQTQLGTLGTLGTSASKEAATDTDDLDLTGDADFGSLEVIQPERCRVCRNEGPPEPEVVEQPELKREEKEETEFREKSEEKKCGEEKAEMKSGEEKPEKSEDEKEKHQKIQKIQKVQNSESKETEAKQNSTDERKPSSRKKAEASQAEAKARERSTSSVRVRIVPPRPPQSERSNDRGTNAATGGASRSSSVKERPRMATQLHIPVSARLASRRSAAGNPEAKAGHGNERGSAERPPRCNSARELSRPLAPSGTLEVADVARLVASPEIGTLDDFMPKPLPDPQVLSAPQPEVVQGRPDGAHTTYPNGAEKRPKDIAKEANGTKPRKERSGSPKRAAATRDVPASAPSEGSRTGSRMLWSQQLTALSCSELPRRSPSPQRYPPRTSTPSRGPPNRGTTSVGSRGGAQADAMLLNSRSQKKLATWKPRTRPSEAREAGNKQRSPHRRRETSEES